MKTKTVEISPLQLGLGAAALWFFFGKSSSSSAGPTPEETAANEAASARRVLPDTAQGQRSNYAIPRPQTTHQLPDTYEDSNANAAPAHTPVMLPDTQAGAAGAGPTPPVGPSTYAPAAGPSWYVSGLGYFQPDAFGDSQLDPRRQQWLDLSNMVADAQAEVDAAWDSYSSSIMNRLCAGIGFCPAYSSVEAVASSSKQLGSALIALSQELQGDPDAKYADGSSKAQVYQQLGAKYVGTIQSIVSTINDDSATAALKDFIVRFPQSIRTVLAWTAQTAGDTAAALGWGLTKTLLIVGAGVAAVGWLMKKGGTKLDVGPLKIG